MVTKHEEDAEISLCEECRPYQLTPQGGAPIGH